MAQPHIVDSLRDLRPVSLPLLSDRPLVSVLMANYNYANFIGKAIESLQAQTWGNWELILCNDGSTDNSLEVASRYALLDKRITIISQTNRGQTNATNAAFSMSRGDVIALLDSDDLFAPAKLESVVKAFHSEPKAGLAIHTLQRIDRQGLATGTNFPRSLAAGWLAPSLLTHGGTPPEGFPTTSALSFRREVADLIFPVPERVVADAYLSGTSALLTEVTSMNEDLALYRIHGANTQGSRWPNSDSCLLTIKYHAAVIVEQEIFARRYYGEGVASLLQLKDCVHYLATLLKYHLLTASWPDGDENHSVKGLITALGSPLLWKILFCLPRPLSVLLLRLWDGQYPLKRFLSYGFRHLTKVMSGHQHSGSQAHPGISNAAAR